MSLEGLKGVGKQTCERLRSAGVSSLEALAVLGVRDLQSLTGMDEKRATDLIQQARSILGLEIRTAEEILQRRKTPPHNHWQPEPGQPAWRRG